MPGKFPFRSSSPANPHIEPKSLTVSDDANRLADSGSLEVFSRTDSRSFDEDETALRSPTMAQFFKDVERWRNDAAVLKPLWSWTGVVAIASVFEAAGVNAMFGKQYAIAIGLVLIACVALAVKGIVDAKSWRQSVLIFALCLLALVLHVLWVMYSASQG